jgi:hypothetical protein
MAAWGDSRLASNEFLFHAHQVGWRLDCAAFDQMLVKAASSRVSALFQAKVVALDKQTGEWCVSLSDGSIHTAHFVVDATGRAAALARRCRLRPINCDHLVSCCFRAGSRSDGTEGLMIESFAEGWWYAAMIPGGDRVFVCMTDADRVRPLELLSGRGFVRLLAETEHIRRVADLGDRFGRPAIWPAGSRALGSGVFASYAIADWLRCGDPRGLSRYRLVLQREFATYRGALRKYYALQQRWPDSPFWRRRHGMTDPLTGLRMSSPARAATFSREKVPSSGMRMRRAIAPRSPMPGTPIRRSIRLARWVSAKHRKSLPRPFGRQLGSRRIRQDLLALVHRTILAGTGPGAGGALKFCDTRAVSPYQRS